MSQITTKHITVLFRRWMAIICCLIIKIAYLAY
ncbi:TPA: type III secretion system protein YscA [Yersinia enterocolitica]|uniref:Yop proteins translocation protein A n=2 Tax=Yersinia enterocolitica TaxID=630 RepID=YSCA_YERE8|nr:type III secretion system protein YscA [Yersinia enterocolitica]A1JU92.1 RecName: Full=Yop proteins translocation protein A [Yersinia enterocolitica subsp. enterocolitica 8081]P0C2M7.1 RecName: Full=Yop proteins translocation protein A [Yersinia enterocolitica]AAC37018.1 yscA [Yersinia enterocolitica]AAD16834.1 YscA [Yersinia enterocolitica W22703]AAK69233.1 YscA [Yersinia enterocolitica]AAN37513.1 YscA [Yersinia enterocolitica]ALG80871.1 preprotein translocase A [Yersinia enterocolitica]